MSTAATQTESRPQGLDLYELRDDLAHSYNPTNAHERMLVTQIALAWQRLVKSYDREEQFFGGRPMDEVMKADFEKFKAMKAYMSECERAWRRAVENLEAAQRRRLRGTLASPNSRTSQRFFRPDITSSPEIHPIQKNEQDVAAPEPECYIGSAATRKPNARESAISGRTETRAIVGTDEAWRASDRVEAKKFVTPQSLL